MGQATRTTKLSLSFSRRDQGGANSQKRAALEATWAEFCTVATAAHPQPWPGWNFSERFVGMPFA